MGGLADEDFAGEDPGEAGLSSSLPAAGFFSSESYFWSELLGDKAASLYFSLSAFAFSSSKSFSCSFSAMSSNARINILILKRSE